MTVLPESLLRTVCEHIPVLSAAHDGVVKGTSPFTGGRLLRVVSASLEIVTIVLHVEVDDVYWLVPWIVAEEGIVPWSLVAAVHQSNWVNPYAARHWVTVERKAVSAEHTA